MAITKKIENAPILPSFNTDSFSDIKINPGGFLCFCIEYISLRTKQIYKMSILEEVIPMLVLKSYFKLGILHPFWLWILLI